MLDLFISLFRDVKAIKSGRDPHEERKVAARQAITKRVRNSSLSCNACKKLAPPILDSGDKYRCVGCGRQFAGGRHDLRPGIYADLISCGVLIDGGSNTTNLPIIESAYERAVGNIKNNG